MKKILITHNLDQKYIEQIASVIPDWELIVSKDKEIYQKHAKDAEIIAGWKKGLEEHCLTPHSNLKWLQTWSAGVDSLPLETIQSKNITLTSANGVHAYPISKPFLP